MDEVDTAYSYITLNEYRQLLKWAEENGDSVLVRKLRRYVKELERDRG